MARIGEMQANWSGAIQSQRTAVRFHPAEAMHHAQLARYLMETGSWDEAEQQARRAVELGRGDHQSLLTLGEVLMRLGELDDARAVAARAASAEPNRPSARRLLEEIEAAASAD